MADVLNNETVIITEHRKYRHLVITCTLKERNDINLLDKKTFTKSCYPVCYAIVGHRILTGYLACIQSPDGDTLTHVNLLSSSGLSAADYAADSGHHKGDPLGFLRHINIVVRIILPYLVY